MTEYKLALVGFGGVNRALAQLIAERNQLWKKQLGFSLKIVGVTDLFLGSLIGREGLDAGLLAKLPAVKGALSQLPGGSAEALNEQVIKESGADIIAEAEQLVGNHVPLADAARLVHPHPTFSETLGEALLKADGRPLHTR